MPRYKHRFCRNPFEFNTVRLLGTSKFRPFCLKNQGKFDNRHVILLLLLRSAIVFSCKSSSFGCILFAEKAGPALKSCQGNLGKRAVQKKGIWQQLVYCYILK